jgi:regulator of replication initiation timing
MRLELFSKNEESMKMDKEGLIEENINLLKENNNLKSLVNDLEKSLELNAKKKEEKPNSKLQKNWEVTVF